LPPRLPAEPAGFGRGGRRHGFFAGCLGNLLEVFAQAVRVDLLEFAADLAHHARQIFVRSQRQNGEAGADLARAIVDRAQRPGLGQHITQRGAQRRVARVSRLQLIQAARQLGREARFVHFEMLQDGRQIRAARIQQLHQIVLHLDVIVRARKAQTGRGFQRVARGIVQLPDQRPEIHWHTIPSVAVNSAIKPYLPGRARRPART
jgi:hypothetical protein